MKEQCVNDFSKFPMKFGQHTSQNTNPQTFADSPIKLKLNIFSKPTAVFVSCSLSISKSLQNWTGIKYPLLNPANVCSFLDPIITITVNRTIT